MTTKHKGNEVHLGGNLPRVGEAMPNIRFLNADLTEGDLAGLHGKVVVLFSMLSVDTGVCAAESRTFNQRLSAIGAVGLAISADLPFALKRFCAAEDLPNVTIASDVRYRDMDKLGVRMVDGLLAGMLARVVFLVDPQGVLRYTQVVPEVSTEPDYEAVLAEVNKLL
ncbi:MAG: thiol peroxidase [Flavobacteriales bacterium]|nr:thiol peroxidase [Flavobacteriales bacterium]MBP9079618.1 thiol peroxidase [Flavobacteriales bacterium]